MKCNVFQVIFAVNNRKYFAYKLTLQMLVEL